VKTSTALWPWNGLSLVTTTHAPVSPAQLAAHLQSPSATFRDWQGPTHHAVDQRPWAVQLGRMLRTYGRVVCDVENTLRCPSDDGVIVLYVNCGRAHGRPASRLPVPIAGSIRG
jgi:hypothetical protein